MQLYYFEDSKTGSFTSQHCREPGKVSASDNGSIVSRLHCPSPASTGLPLNYRPHPGQQRSSFKNNNTQTAPSFSGKTETKKEASRESTSSTKPVMSAKVWNGSGSVTERINTIYEKTNRRSEAGNGLNQNSKSNIAYISRDVTV